MSTKELNKEINELREVLELLLDTIYDYNLQSILRYYFSQHNYKEMIKFLTKDN